MLGLHVAVDVAEAMRGVEDREHADRDRRRLVGRERAPAHQDAREALAVGALHHDIRRAVVDRSLVGDGDDPRVHHAARDLGLAAEPTPEIGVVEEARAQRLDDDRAPVFEARRLEHDAGSADADPLTDAVLPLDDGPA